MYLGVAEQTRGYFLLNIDTHYTLTSRDVKCLDDSTPGIRSIDDVENARRLNPRRNCYTVDIPDPEILPPLRQALAQQQTLRGPQP